MLSPALNAERYSIADARTMRHRQCAHFAREIKFMAGRLYVSVKKTGRLPIYSIVR